jgi:hypothetical protein
MSILTKLERAIKSAVSLEKKHRHTKKRKAAKGRRRRTAKGRFTKR